MGEFNMKKVFCTLFLLLFTASTAIYAQNIIPKPKKAQMNDGAFTINSKTRVVVADNNPLFMEIAEDLVATINRSTGYSIPVEKVAPDEKLIVNNIVILKSISGLGKEAYNLDVTPNSVVIGAAEPNGLFYGTQTLLQLLPAEIYSKVKSRAKWSVPCCTIEDEPYSEYRGLMVDCCRYFMPKEHLLKVIDVMAMHKQNIFHWHLTDDQGWRIEIKKYPKLTEVGAFRSETTGYDNVSDNTPHGGYYTQEDVKEIVEYARRRYVTVVPEIELPGHASAAIAAYPELSCNPDKDYKVATGWGVMKDVFCPNAATFQFFEDVFTELFELFPGPYYHIGGDECPRDAWKESKYCNDFMKVMGFDNYDQIQIFFVQRIDKFLREKGGKQVIGWDEILDGGAVKSTIALSYRGHAPAKKAIANGMRTILTPNRWCYLDYYQENMETEYNTQSMFLPLSKVYNYNPISDTVSAEKRKLIIGTQGCVWSEFNPTPEIMEFRAFPRAIALSETGWTQKYSKDFADFCYRMHTKGFRRLDMKEMNYSKAFYTVIFKFDHKEPFPQDVELELNCPDTEIRYTTDGTAPTRKSKLYTEPFKGVKPGDVITAQGFCKKTGKKVGKQVTKHFKETTLN